MPTSHTFGGEQIRNEILEQLQLRKLAYQHLTHQETNPHLVAKEIGVDVHEGIKCLIMRGKKSMRNYLICVLGHQRVDMKALSALVDENCEFEKIDSIQERFGLEVGGIPPFGSLLGLDIYFDTGIQNCKEVIFSCGPLNESIRMKLEDLIPLVHPRFAKLAKE